MESERSPNESVTMSAWRDGRSVGRHIVDRALDYAALHRGGLTAAQIARRRKKSKGYVSIVLRLGSALRGLDSEELEVFRSERITWKLAQRIVRADVTEAEIQRQLRYALGGFSSHNIDGRKLRKHRRNRVKGQSDMAQAPTGAIAEPGVFVWRWDAEWVARDPLGYVDAYRTYLASLHRHIRGHFGEAAAVRVARAAPASVPMVGQSLRRITALIAQQQRAPGIHGIHAAQRTSLSSADRAAVASLRELDGILGPTLLSHSSSTAGTEPHPGLHPGLPRWADLSDDSPDDNEQDQTRIKSGTPRPK